MNRPVLVTLVTLVTLEGLALGGCYTGFAADDDSVGGTDPSAGTGVGEGDSGSDPDDPDDPGPSAQCEGSEPYLPPTVRGLNSRQFANTIAAVFPGVEPPADLFYDSDRSANYSTRSTIRRLDFKTTSELIKVAEAVSVDAANVVRAQYPCLQETPAAPDCVSWMLAEVTSKLYREPAPGEHLVKLQALFNQAAAATNDEVALQFVNYR